MGWRHLVAALDGMAMAYLAVTTILVLVAVAPVVIGWRPHLVASGSMAPAFGAGDVVLVAPAKPGRYYEPGAVITFRVGTATVTHRVVATEFVPGGAAYETKGDANRVADSSRVDHTEVIGAVRLIVPFVGRPVAWMRRNEWLFLGLWLASVVVALSIRDVERLITRRPAGVPKAQGAGVRP